MPVSHDVSFRLINAAKMLHGSACLRCVAGCTRSEGRRRIGFETFAYRDMSLVQVACEIRRHKRRCCKCWSCGEVARALKANFDWAEWQCFCALHCSSQGSAQTLRAKTCLCLLVDRPVWPWDAKGNASQQQLLVVRCEAGGEGMLCMLKENSKRQEALDVSTAPSAGECKTKSLETAGVGAKETTCEAGSCCHEFSPLRLLFCLTFSFKTCVNAVEGWETGLAAQRLSASLAPWNFSSGTLAHVVAFHASSRVTAYTSAQCLSRLVLVSEAFKNDVPEGWQGQLLTHAGCQKGAFREGPVNTDFD